MKILHVINDLSYGGAEKLLVDLLPELHKKGVEVELAVLRDVSSVYMQRLRQNDIKINIIGKSNYDVRNIFKLAKVMSRFDIVHAHLFPSFYLVALARILTLKDKVLVVTDHNVSHKRAQNWLARKMDLWIYRRYAWNVAITKDVEDALLQRGVQGSKIVVIPNGVNLTKFLPVVKDNKTFTIGMAGRLKSPKRQETIIKALPLLPENISLHLAGIGEDLDRLTSLSLKLNVQDRVNFLGFCDDIPGFYRSIDIHVFASKAEGFGLSAAESMAMGVPTIATDTQGLREVIGEGGILFIDGDEKDLARKIMQLYTNETYFKQISQKGIVQSSQFALDKMVDNYLSLYNKVRR